MSVQSPSVSGGVAMHSAPPERVYQQSEHTIFGPTSEMEEELQEEEFYVPPSGPLTRDCVIASARHFRRLKPLTTSPWKFTWLWLLIIWGWISVPVIMPYLIGCSNAFYLILAVLLFILTVWILAIVFCIRYMWLMYRGQSVDYQRRYVGDATSVRHIVLMAIYKDEMDVIMRTLRSLADQTIARTIILVVAWESRTPDRQDRTKMIVDAHANSFQQILFTVHPSHLPHEIASHAANVNWALRYAVRHLFERAGYSNADHFTVTTCDSDAIFHRRYFESLTADYSQLLIDDRELALRSIFQSPLMYHWNLDKRSFITRITGVMRSVMTMGMLIPYSVNSMSCYSFPLPLGIRAGYYHPQLFMDDVGFLLTMQIGIQHRVHLRCLPVPVINGPTSGETWLLDIYEWFIQVRRWAIGTSDNFHYSMTKITRMPASTVVAFSIGYFLYYGLILCSSHFFHILTWTVALHTCPDDPTISHWSPTILSMSEWTFVGDWHLYPSRLVLLLAFIFPYGLYACMYILDGIWCRWILHVKEDIHPLRNLWHWIWTGPCMLVYALTQLLGYHIIAFQGKVGACVHKVTNKAGMGSVGGFDEMLLSEESIGDNGVDDLTHVNMDGSLPRRSPHRSPPIPAHLAASMVFDQLFVDEEKSFGYQTTTI